ncbi:MAG: EAL domain-containing protein [Campylobacterales bacterium]|nr:EAL domain-containing protein [Campylobacterales bacterium]
MVECNLDISEKINTVAITPEQYNHILALQQELLSLTAYENDTQSILNRLCSMAEALLPNSVASLMLYDITRSHLNVKAAPSISQEAIETLNGIVPGPYAGSCGNAVYKGEPQYIINALEDERGRDFFEKAKAFNLCSCWSMPVHNEHQETIGSFALSSFEHRSPDEFHKKLLEVCAALVTLVLKNEKMALNDTLTGLKNKTSLQKEIKKSFYNTLIFLDVNNFSYINSAYGFKVGDEVLLLIAKELETIVPLANIYRINSDQFALLFAKEIDIQKQVEQIQKHFSTITLNIQNITLKISFNYGGVYANHDLLKHAALSVKKAKERGKNRLYMYDAKIDDSNRRAEFIAINSQLHEAFEQDLIVPHFQGIYDNFAHKITKYEALMRVVTKDGKVIPPMDLLHVARLSGLLPRLTEIMIEKSFAYMSQNGCDFSINITEEDLNNQYLLEYLLKMSKKYSIEPYRVNLEILEGISATGKNDNIEQLKELKRKGFKISIDDFGAEYSNFERVLELDVDIIKIDARYIKNIDKDKKSYEITKAIVSFAQNMQIQIVAEFVHSKEVQQIVANLGIDYSQGFYFSEPAREILI